jgi:hypothetical protein
LQTYFSCKSCINYFIVVESAIAVAQSKSSSKLPATEQECLEKIKKDFESVKGDIVEQASIVQGFGDSKSAQVPWLEKTAFLSYLAGLTLSPWDYAVIPFFGMGGGPCALQRDYGVIPLRRVEILAGSRLMGKLKLEYMIARINATPE